MLDGMPKSRKAMIPEHAKKSPRKQVEKNLPRKAVYTYVPRESKIAIANVRGTCCAV